uniref:Uncharacterized protein n=1 Tax=Arundo donax TaxID=35708 RepID=A0A0A8ZCA7_ARUDO
MLKLHGANKPKQSVSLHFSVHVEYASALSRTC